MNQLDKSDRSLEAQLGTDEETLFRILARRNRLLMRQFGNRIAIYSLAV